VTDERIIIWNILHDGSISAAEVSNLRATIFVSIPYLRRRIPPLGDSFVLKLTGVTTCEFRHFDGETTSLEKALQVGEPEVLSTDSVTFPLTIHTTMGQLVLAFEDVSYFLDSGEATTFEAIQKAATEYWATSRSVG
jgi:hypothetical protein